MSRSKYYSNQYATIQGEATSCRVEQEGSGNLLNVYRSTTGARPAQNEHREHGGQVARPEGNMTGSQYTFGKGLTGNRKGGSFGNAALQKADIPSTSHARDLRENRIGHGGGAKRVNVNGGYRYKR